MPSSLVYGIGAIFFNGGAHGRWPRVGALLPDKLIT
jgi:hypothetical protein